MLRNKISALRSRMKRKQELWESTEKIGGFTSKFSSFLNILQEELKGPEGSKIAKKIQRRIDKQLGVQTKTDKQRTLADAVKDFIGMQNH